MINKSRRSSHYIHAGLSVCKEPVKYIYPPRRSRRYLCDAAVDVHRRHGKLASLGQLMETVDSHDALLHDALECGKRRRTLLPHAVSCVAAVVEYLHPAHTARHFGVFLGSLNLDDLALNGLEGKRMSVAGAHRHHNHYHTSLIKSYHMQSKKVALPAAAINLNSLCVNSLCVTFGLTSWPITAVVQPTRNKKSATLPRRQVPSCSMHSKCNCVPYQNQSTGGLS